MKSMSPNLATIYFMTYFYRAGVACHPHPPDLLLPSALWSWICQCVGLFRQTNITTALLKSCKSRKSGKKYLSERETVLGCPSAELYSVADPGFSPGGGANSQNCYHFSHFCRKLHENERIWTPKGGACVPGAPPWIRQWYCLLFQDYPASCDLRDVVVGQVSTNPMGCLILKIM